MNRIAIIATLAIVLIFVLAIYAVVDEQSGIDCGPEGKPVQNNTACIDKNPVVIRP